MALTQEKRLIAVSSPLGKDVLLFHRLQATEELSRLFEFTLDLLSEAGAIRSEDLLGQPLTVRLELPAGGFRYFNGHVSRFSTLGTYGRYTSYQAILRPWLWFLTRTADCRIFQEQTAPDILKRIFRENGFTDFKEALSASYQPREYCVQYRETDFNFLSRLLEQEGIYYYFRHEEGKHTLVLCDSYSAHDTVAGYEKIPYFPPDIHGRRERDHIVDWRLTHDLQPGAYALNDFDFKAPKKNLRSAAAVARQHAQASFEIYDYPGNYWESANGEAYARLRIEELQTQHEIAQGHGNARGLSVGALFTLTDYPREDQNREYLITSAIHELHSNEYESDRTGAPEVSYDCRFTALAAQQPFRPRRTTLKPIVQGPQTAIVVGKPGEEIWTDQYGRVKCQFHWDRYGKSDENSSCWVRVSHPWAGKNWGAVTIPRIGQEVIVDFLEGDPDQPIITGRVYNADQMPPYGLPGGAVVSGMKSNSTKGGGGYNEISMDDTKGTEKITVHGQYDMNTTVEHDQTNTINNNRSTTVVVDDTLNVNANRTVHVKGKLSETIDSGQDVTVSSGYKETITAGATSTISGGKTLRVTEGFTEGVTGARKMTVTGPIDIHATGAGTYTSDTSLKFAVAGSVIEITPAAITISAAGSTIKVDATGVAISGVKISLNG